jgi:acyl-CoA reductase-like NAD-dependent aldehyde dehydrogenase
MKKIEAGMTRIEETLCGLTGGLDLDVLDTGYGQRNDSVVSYAPVARRFGAVLPANSPGVHALWLPAIALKIPVALKPGQREPWTPLRILEAFKKAGYPGEGFAFYPSGHDGASTILLRSDAGMMFGAGATVEPWRRRGRVEIHGPGYSKILLGGDKSAEWENYLDLMVTSIAGNSGRSCVNASSVRTASHGRELAQALAERLAPIMPRSRDDVQAELAAFSDPAIAIAIDAAIEQGLAQGGAEDITAGIRGSKRLVEFEGGTYLLPTVIHCDSTDHSLANQEYLFPFVSVVETNAEELLPSTGPSLVLSALTEEEALVRALLARSDIGRLNIGPLPTTQIEWNQPHEGNLFEMLFEQRAFQRASFAAVGAPT